MILKYIIIIEGELSCVYDTPPPPQKKKKKKKKKQTVVDTNEPSDTNKHSTSEAE